MRNTLRLLAVVKPGHYLEAGNPTGLTGLFNHPAPRSTLLYLYGATLDKLKAFPEHSVYRQSTEALTKHRMKIIEAIKPNGYEEWQKRATEKIEKYPEAFQPGGQFAPQSAGDQNFVTIQEQDNEDSDGESVDVTGSSEDKAGNTELFNRLGQQEFSKAITWEPEPPLDASQINDVEQQIGGGLIEEVIQVAEGELKLVETMAESQVWGELEEKPPEGQWDYFARDQHTPGSQEPPNK